MAASFREHRTDTTVMLAVLSAGAAVPIKRRSEHVRAGRSGRGWTTRTADVPGGHVDVGDLTEEIVTVRDQLIETGREVSLRVRRCVRSVEREGVTLTRTFDEWQVLLGSTRGLARRCRAGSGRELFDEAIAAVAPSAPHAGPDVPASPPRQRLLLTPQVAAVVLHELIGHGMEEGSWRAGERVLPSGTEVNSLPHRGASVDDENSPAAEFPLVRDGLLVGLPRTRTDSDRGPGTGHAWCAPHSPQPCLRLPDLRVRATHLEQVPPDTPSCVEVTSGRFAAGACAIALAAPAGGGTAMSPSFLVLDASALKDSVFVVAPQGTRSPVGTCVKNGDELASRIEVPGALLVTAEVYS